MRKYTITAEINGNTSGVTVETRSESLAFRMVVDTIYAVIEEAYEDDSEWTVTVEDETGHDYTINGQGDVCYETARWDEEISNWM